MKSTLYKATLESWWWDNDGDKHKDWHSAYIRLYDNGEAIYRAGFDSVELTLDDETSYSLRGTYTIEDDIIHLELKPAPGKNEKIDWTDVEMKYGGALVYDEYFLSAGNYEAKMSNGECTIKDLKFCPFEGF